MRLLRTVALASLGALFASAAYADDISVVNPSFETLPTFGLNVTCGTGCAFSTGGIIPGWTTSSPDSGEFQPGTQDGNTTYFSSLSDGITSAYANSGTISQTVGVTVQPGVTYTLQVDLGARNDLPFDASAELLVGGTAFDAVGADPTAGNWSTFTAMFTGTQAEAGDPITIELITSGTQANFDDVRVSDNLSAAVPEPSSLPLFVIGLLGTLGIGPLLRRRSQLRRCDRQGEGAVCAAVTLRPAEVLVAAIPPR